MIDFNLPCDFKWVDTSAPQFNHALDLLVNSRDNMLIMGPGGTGKSLLLEMTYRMLSEMENILIVTPTGISSSNIAIKGVPASTINSAFSIAPADLYEKVVEANDKQIDVLQHLDTLVFDEISMCNPALLDQVWWVLNEIRPHTLQNLRIIFFGDVLQLPPVVQLDIPEVFDYYKSQYNLVTEFFASHFYNEIKSSLKVCILDKIYRQSDDSFSNILNRVRQGLQTDKDLEILNTRVIDPVDYINSHDFMLYLASTNARVDGLNEAYNSMFKDCMHRTYVSRSEGTLKRKVEDQITLYVGQQVMCTANNKEEGYQNGTLGIVTVVNPNSVIIKKLTGDYCTVSYATTLDHRLVYDYVTKRVKIERPGSYSQIACKPAFACTIHKSQSLTLDNIYIDLCNWVPTAGVYLALSRCKSLEGIGLMRPLTHSDIKVNRVALDFYNDLIRNEG